MFVRTKCKAFCFSTHITVALFLLRGIFSAFASKRLCSHLLDCSRRELPATFVYLKTLCSDFPHRFCPPKVAAKSSVLSEVEGLFLDRLGTLNFVSTYGRQNWRNYPAQN